MEAGSSRARSKLNLHETESICVIQELQSVTSDLQANVKIALPTLLILYIPFKLIHGVCTTFKFKRISVRLVT